MSSGIVHVEDAGNPTLSRAIKVLAGVEGGINKAVYNASVRAMNKGKTEAGRFAAAEYTIGKGTFMSNVKEKTKVTSGVGGIAGVAVTYSGRLLPLITFSTRYSRNGGVQTTVKRGGGGSIRRAFITSFSKLGVYERTGKDRFPIEQKYGPSTGHMMQNETVIESMEEAIVDTFNSRIEHEITRLLNGW